MEIGPRKHAISVIMPMYNASMVLEKSLRSLCAQTFRDFEIVIINDCSTDNTVDRVKQVLLEENTEGITLNIISHDNNRGVASARNTGIANALGDYLYFVDADDYIDPETLELMYNASIQNNADICGIEWFLTFSKNERHVKQRDVHTGEELFNAFSSGVMRWNLWLFMVKRSLLLDNQLEFIPGVNMGEDMMIMMKLSLLAGNVVIVHKPLYHYIQTNSGAQTKNWTQKNRDQVSENVQSVASFCKEKFGNEYDVQIDLLKLNLKLPMIISDKKADFEIWKSWFPESNKSINFNHELPFRTKLIQIAADKGQFWLVRLYYWLVIKFVYGVIFK